MPLIVAVAGASGILGAELLRVMEDQAFAVGELRPIGDADEIEESKIEGRAVEFLEEEVAMRPESAEVFDGCDVVFLAGTPEQAARLAKLSFLRAPITIDLSGHFADDSGVPLVLTEIGTTALDALPPRCLIAVPDAATAMVALTLAPLHKEAVVTRATISTYESASGRGRPGMDELGFQIKELFNYRSASPVVFPKPIAFNCLPQVDAFEPNGYTRGEMAMAHGVARVLEDPKPTVSATRVWVPVFSGHSASIVVETGKPLTVAQARGLLEKAPGVEILDDTAEGVYPVNGETIGYDAVSVGRLRADADGRLSMWIAADNLRRGAAIAAVKAAQAILERRQRHA